MSAHRPDHDRLTAYLEGALSVDAMQWVERHLESCKLCREAVQRERRMLRGLDRLGGIELPQDFVEGVMARVAQYPAYQPTKKIPLRRVAAWAAGLAACLVVVLAAGAWFAVQSQVVSDDEVSGVLYRVIRNTVDYGGDLVRAADQLLTPAYSLFRALGTAVFQIFRFVAESGWVLQLGLLLVTVTLNYLFTRMVLNYQRRH